LAISMSSRIVVAACLLLGACASRPPPPPSHDLPELPPPIAQTSERSPSSGDEAKDPPPFPRPTPTGDRERDALELGFWACRVMGVRLAPKMSGRATLRATLGNRGEVIAVAVERAVDLPRPVVQCLVNSVARTRFDARGGYGSFLQIPVDFTKPPKRTAPPPATGNDVPTFSL
jgi:hypothetical protein